MATHPATGADADRAKAIVNNAIVNEDETARVIRELREELARVRSMLGQNGGGGDPADAASAAEVIALRKRVEEDEYLLAEANRTWQEKLQVPTAQRSGGNGKSSHALVCPLSVAHSAPRPSCRAWRSSSAKT